MGIFSDITVPIRELIEPTEGLGARLIGEKLRLILGPVRHAKIELKIRALATLAQQREQR